MSNSTFTEKPEVNKHNWFKMHSDKHMIRCALFSDLALSGLELLNAFPDDGWVCVIHNTTRLRWRHNEQLLQAIHGKHLPLNRSFSDTNTSKKWHFLNMTFKMNHNKKNNRNMLSSLSQVIYERECLWKMVKLFID